MKEKYITWNSVNPLIRERFYILGKRIDDIGFVTSGGNFMVSLTAIVDAFNDILYGGYTEEETSELLEWIQNIIKNI